MWRGSDGVVHTVALPDPSEPFTPSALAGVRRVVGSVPYDDVAAVIERLEESVVDHWDTQPFDESTEASFAKETPFRGLFDCVVASLPELEAALEDVDPRWRLDLAMAVDDLSDPAWT